MGTLFYSDLADEAQRYARSRDRNTPAGVLRLIADHLQRVGVSRSGDGYDVVPGKRYEDSPACVIHAEGVLGLRGAPPPVLAADQAIEDYLDRTGDTRSLVDWSDTADPAEVIGTLYRLADELDAA